MAQQVDDDGAEALADDGPSIADLGAAIRLERHRRGMSLATLSERSGVSFGLISGLERGRGNPSFRSIGRLAVALDVPLAKLLAVHDGDDMVVRLAERGLLPVDPGAAPEQRVRRELLTPRSSTSLQLIRSTLPPGFSNESQPFRHLGTEAVTVEQGLLLLVHGERRLTLEPGDSATYGCSTPHWWANASDGVTIVLGAVSPFEG